MTVAAISVAVVSQDGHWETQGHKKELRDWLGGLPVAQAMQMCERCAREWNSGVSPHDASGRGWKNEDDQVKALTAAGLLPFQAIPETDRCQAPGLRLPASLVVPTNVEGQILLQGSTQIRGQHLGVVCIVQ